MLRIPSNNTVLVCLALLFSTQATLANSDSRATNDWLKTAQNPLSPDFSIPLNYTLHGGAESGDVSVWSIDPIMPIKLSSVSIINQMSLKFLSTAGGITGISELPEPYSNNSGTGLADLNFTSYVSPVSSLVSDDFTWGIGPAFVFPTDYPDRETGSGKFSVGPAALIVYQPGPWTLGFKSRQIWSVFGNDTRQNVSQLILEPFADYNLGEGWYLTSDMDMIANWNSDSDNRWTVPLGGGVGKLFNLDNFAINTKLQAYYNVVRPDSAPDWSMNFTLQFMLPKFY